MAIRLRFGPEFLRAIQVRGLTLPELASRAEVATATASAAARGSPVNVWTALKLSRALAAAPIVTELDAWLLPASPVGDYPAEQRDRDEEPDARDAANSR